ncbi:hydantoinase/oxoprolinase family protein, partial [Achromobacter sp. AGC39]
APRRARPHDHIAAGQGTAARVAGTRPVYDAAPGRRIDIPVYERQSLDPEQTLTGPALVVEDETTTFVPPGFVARRSRLGSLVLDDARAARRHQADAADKDHTS